MTIPKVLEGPALPTGTDWKDKDAPNLALCDYHVPKLTQVPNTKRQESTFLITNRNYVTVVTKWGLNKTRYRDN